MMTIKKWKQDLKSKNAQLNDPNAKMDQHRKAEDGGRTTTDKVKQKKRNTRDGGGLPDAE